MTCQAVYLAFVPLPTPCSKHTQIMATMDIEMASPVGPLVAVGYDQDRQFGIPVRTIDRLHGDGITQLHAVSQAYQSEVDLCQLLQAMSLTKGKFKVSRFHFVSEAIIDDRWKKGSRDRPCPRCIAKCTRARCKHRGPGIPCKSFPFPPQPFLSLSPITPL